MCTEYSIIPRKGTCFCYIRGITAPILVYSGGFSSLKLLPILLYYNIVTSASAPSPLSSSFVASACPLLPMDHHPPLVYFSHSKTNLPA